MKTLVSTLLCSTALMLVGLSATPASAHEKPCCYNNGGYFNTTPSTCYRYGGRVIRQEYCQRYYQGNNGYDQRYYGDNGGYGDNDDATVAGGRVLWLDTLAHSYVVLGHDRALQFDYPNQWSSHRRMVAAQHGDPGHSPGWWRFHHAPICAQYPPRIGEPGTRARSGTHPIGPAATGFAAG